MATADPFYAVRDALGNEVKGLQVKFGAWQGMLQSVNTATDTTFRLRHEEMGRELGKVEEMCRKVRLAVTNIDRNRAKYPHIDDMELHNRKVFVENLERAVFGMKDTYASRETRGKLDADAKRELQYKAVAETRPMTSATSAYTAANTDYLRDQSQQQAQMRRDQDQVLDKMANGLEVLDNMAKAIENELKEQDAIMTDVGAEMDVAQNKMDAAIKHVEKLLKTKDKCQLATIAILVVAFLIVAIAAFYVLTN